MKRLYLIILLAAVALSGMAQTIGEAFYIYRNDGQFNAFNRGEVLSMEFSYEDADGNLYDEVVTQIVNTVDSIYKIPLAAIDSIGFVQPETIVSSDVFPLTAEHSPYITDGDVLSFTMSASAPETLRPKVGNIVVATADCSAFPDGIIARVESVSSTGYGYLYTCSQAYYDEVFDQLVAYQSGMGDGEAPVRAFDLRRASLNTTLWNENWSRTIEDSGTTTTLNVGGRAMATVTVCKTLTTPLYFQLQLQNEMTSSIGFNAESTASISKELQIGNTITAGKITIPYTMGLLWMKPKLSLFGYFEEQGKVELNYSGRFNRTDIVTFTYSERKWDFSHRPVTDVDTDVAGLSMEGSAEIGLKPQIDFTLNGQQTSFGLSARVGLKEYSNFVFDATRLSDGSLYNAMRDSYCRTTIPWSVTAHANANVFSRYDASQTDDGPDTFSQTFAPSSEPLWGEDRYIFPLFADVKAQRQASDKTKADASASVSRTPLLPVQVGFSLLDKDGKILQTQYDSRSYKAGSLFNSYSTTLSSLEASGKYTVRPSVRLFEYDILASPSANIDANHTSCPDANHPHMIDLGLPSGTKWACCNVGALAPEGYGDYYAWGETSPKSVYDRDTYAYYNSKTGYVHIGMDITGTVYDVATVNWGAPWRMPSWEQIKELEENTTWTWATQNGVYGTKFVGPNGGIVFLPDAGRRRYGELDLDGGYYWSSTIYETPSDISDRRAIFLLSSILAEWFPEERDFGFSVRPVCYGGEETSCPDSNHPHMIDLGLPSGTKWACCNVGASKPEGYGNYYAWGETSPKSGYYVDTYAYYNGETGYVNIGSDIAGTDYDAATVNWGAPWRMPSLAQVQELVNNTTSVWITQNGVYGRKIVGPNGGTVFLPAAGTRFFNDLVGSGGLGEYWSSTLIEGYPSCAYDYLISYYGRDYGGMSIDGNRHHGNSIRPVRKN